MHNPIGRFSRNITLLLGSLLATAQLATAQALVTAQRGTEIAPFAQVTLLDPDWGPTANFGYSAGVDYTRFIRSIVQPSLELRFTSADGSTVSERSFSGGLKLQTAIHGIRPYATFLVGDGEITFTHPGGNYLGDRSVVYSLGAGAGFNVTPQWELNLDFTHQQWNLGTSASLTPTTLGVGIAYRIPFHNGSVR